MSNKKRIMHYYTYPENSGGPLTYINTILSSSLSKNYNFSTCFQLKPFSKIRLRDVSRIINEIKEFNPDILHVHGLQGEGFIGVLSARIAKCKFVLMTVHGMQHDALTINKFKKIVFKYLIEPITLKMSDAVYCVCEATEKRSIVQKNSKRLHPYIHNSVHEIDYVYDRSECRNKLGINDNDIVVVIVGRVSIDKGMKVLEECVKHDMNNRIKYLIVGEGDYFKLMKNNLSKYEETNKVIFVGSQKNVAPYLKMSDIYLTATLHENLSIAILEACLAKLPCVVTEVGGNTEIIQNGVSGYTIAPNNYEEVLVSINKLANSESLRSEFGYAAYNLATTQFSEEKLIQQLDQLYTKITESYM